MSLAERSPRFVLFGGKGGVGKTTCAAAHAFARAARGERVLLVTLDPARALHDVLGATLGPEARRIATPQGRLEALELDADRALDRWLDERRRVLQTILERGTYLEATDVARFLKLSLPGVDELVGLLELERVALERAPDTVVVDTAPQGHTLRLLAMPETLRRIARVLAGLDRKHRVLVEALGGRGGPDEAWGLVRELDADGARLADLLRDPARCSFFWVLVPETLALEEAQDGARALEGEGFPLAGLVANRVTPASRGTCALCRERRAAEGEVLSRLARGPLARLPRLAVPALEREPRGRAALAPVIRALAKMGRPGPKPRAGAGARPKGRNAARARSRQPFALEVEPGVRLLLFGGKGGVGKTTCAAAAALALARSSPGKRVALLSVDPAHSLGDALATGLSDEARRVRGGPANLLAREVDAASAYARKRESYRASVDALFDVLANGSRLDATHDREIARDLLDLSPPGLDELLALLEVTRGLLPSPRPDETARPGHEPPDLLVLDTAPTGHALRLLAAPATAHEWARTLLSVLLRYRSLTGLGELGRDLLELTRGLADLRRLLVDRERTRFVAVARPEGVPRRETARLVRELERLGVPLGGVIWNAVTPADGCARCRRVSAREARETAAFERERGDRGRARGREARATIAAPATAPPPRGAAALLEWSRAWRKRGSGSGP